MISVRGLKSRLPVAKMHCNVIKEYLKPVTRMRYPYGTVARWVKVKAFSAGRTETADLRCTGRSSIPQHRVDIMSGLLFIDGR